jgi:hypothetical protein
MANVNNPFGFIPASHLNGGDSFLTQTMRLASGYAVTIYNGDPIKLVSGKIQRCAATDIPEGIFVGVKYTDAKGEVQYENTWEASTATKGAVDADARVITDKQVLFEAQFTGTPSVANIGTSFTVTTTAGAVEGRSKVGVTTTATNGHYKLHDFVKDSENEIGEFARGLFLLN